MSVFTVNSGRVLVLGTVAAFAVMGGLSSGQAPGSAVSPPPQANIEPQQAPAPVPSPTPVPTPEPVAAPLATHVLPPPPTPPPRTADVAFPTPGAVVGTGPAVLIGRPVEQPDYGERGNRTAARLRSAAPQAFDFDRASLRDVLRFLADAAGIAWIGIDEHSPTAQKLVTFKMTTSPFSALQSVARQNGLRLTYDDGVWFMRDQQEDELAKVAQKRVNAETENELVGVVYQLKNDPVDRVDFRNEGGSSGGGWSGGGGMSAGGQGTQVTTPNMPLQYSQRVFQAKAPRVVNEIRVLLGMQPLQYNADGTVTDPEITAGKSKERSEEVSTTKDTGSTKEKVTERFEAGPIYIPPQKPQVIYNSDSNILWVVATRKQHKWVAEYLQRVDKPQDLIAIEVKFFETRKNPQTDFGINWEGTFGGDGFVVSGSARVDASGTYGTSDSSQTTTTRDRQVGTQPDGTGPYNYTTSVSRDVSNSLREFAAPFSAVLSTSEASVALQAFARDRDSSLVQYPRVLTINNREVAITAAENTPVNAGVSQTQSGSTATQTGTLGYLPTGTQINILPKTVGKGQIALTVAVTISQIVRYELINLGTGLNPYPVTTQRVYNAALQVDSGYTLAVGGLERTADSKSTGGIPVLKDIPGVGYLFKNKGRSRDKSNLIIFITPYLISDPSRTPGISERPEAVIPLRPGVPPPAPNFTPDGALLGGDSAVPGALAWLEFQLKYFQQTNAEARDDARSTGELRSVIDRARTLTQTLRAQIDTDSGYAAPGLVESSAKADSLLLELNKVLAKAQLDRFQMSEGFP